MKDWTCGWNVEPLVAFREGENNNKQTQTKQMRLKTIMALSMMLVGVGTWSANANLINGSFETPDLQGGWSYFPSILGWTAQASTPLEIGAGSVYGVTGYDGQQVMEMDSTANATVAQIVTSAGGSYNLSLLYALRAGVDPSSGSLDVYWNGNLVTHLAPTTSAMAPYSTTVIGSGSDTLTFVGTGLSDSYGAVVDNVSLTAVPEPTTVLAGALLLLPFGVSTIRSLRRKS